MLTEMIKKYNQESPDNLRIDLDEQANWYIFNYPVSFPCKVVDIMDSAYGKFPDIEEDLDEESS